MIVSPRPFKNCVAWRSGGAVLELDGFAVAIDLIQFLGLEVDFQR
jgi:hypothetical protein